MTEKLNELIEDLNSTLKYLNDLDKVLTDDLYYNLKCNLYYWIKMLTLILDNLKELQELDKELIASILISINEIFLELRYFEDNFMPKDKNDVRFYNLRCATSNCFHVKKCLELI